MKPIDVEQIQGPVQVLLTVLSDENTSTPNNLIEGVVSGKSLLRAILSGNLVVCQSGAPAKAPPVEEVVEEVIDEDGAEAA